MRLPDGRIGPLIAFSPHDSDRAGHSSTALSAPEGSPPPLTQGAGLPGVRIYPAESFGRIHHLPEARLAEVMEVCAIGASSMPPAAHKHGGRDQGPDRVTD